MYLHCKLLFVPDYRNRERQKYCSTPACQAASKRKPATALAEQTRKTGTLAGRRTCNGCRSGKRPIRVIGSVPHAGRSVRYKTPARRNRLPTKRLHRLRYQPSAPVRYKMSAGCKRLCWWGLSPNSPTVELQDDIVPFRPGPDSKEAGHSGSTCQPVRERRAHYMMNKKILRPDRLRQVPGAV